jgi:hypothetical protein
MPGNSIPILFPSSVSNADVIIGKNTIGSSSGLPVPIPSELADEIADFSNTTPVRHVEFWHSGNTRFYNYSNIPLFEQDTSGQLVIKNSGGTTTATLTSSGALSIPSNVTTPGIGTFTTQVISNLGTFGSVSAPFKLFDIPHPLKPGMRLRHGCLEGPELAVYTRGKTKENIIPLPDYWNGLVDPNSITVQLTPTSSDQWLHVIKTGITSVEVSGDLSLPYYFMIMAERIDVEKLQLEYEEPNGII